VLPEERTITLEGKSRHKLAEAPAGDSNIFPFNEQFRTDDILVPGLNLWSMKKKLYIKIFGISPHILQLN
jgi:hypothetical protein